MAVIWFIVAFLSFWGGKEYSWITSGFSGMAIFYLIQYIYGLKYRYLTFSNEELSENFVFGKKIKWSEVEEVKKFAGDYILRTSKSELVINTQIIDEGDLKLLEKELYRYFPTLIISNQS
jgi:hypothetical protein